jgi:ketosteroid isomerase-like protein
MRRACLVVAASSLLAFPVSAGGQREGNGSSVDVAQVRTALTEFLTAFENLDWDAFRASFDDQVTVFFPTPEPPQRFDGRAAVEAHFQEVFKAIRSASPSGPPFQRLDPEDLRIEALSADTALASFHLRNNQRIARRTIVFKRTARGWRIAHLHASNIARE